MAKERTLCAKIPDDLDYAIQDRCQAEGISTSELLRHALTVYLFGQIPGAEEGYQQARRFAIQMAVTAVHSAMDQLPATLDEYVASLKG